MPDIAKNMSPALKTQGKNGFGWSQGHKKKPVGSTTTKNIKKGVKITFHQKLKPKEIFILWEQLQNKKKSKIDRIRDSTSNFSSAHFLPEPFETAEPPLCVDPHLELGHVQDIVQQLDDVLGGGGHPLQLLVELLHHLLGHVGGDWGGGDFLRKPSRNRRG